MIFNVRAPPRFRSEPLLTEIALKRQITRVLHLVERQRSMLCESFPALVAHESSLVSVPINVLPQRVLESESFRANVARKRFAIVVRQQMHFQAAFVRKIASTNVAQKRSALRVL